MKTVPYKTSHGTNWIPIESRLLSDGRIFILGEITSVSANEFIQELMYLKSEYPEMIPQIFINSPGGDVNAGLLIYDALKGLDTEFDTYCIGLAASMAATILAGGRKGRRFILPHSNVLIHEPRISSGFGGAASSVQKTAESMIEIRDSIARLLAADTGKNFKAVKKAISYENSMSAEDAVEFGICDRIVTNVFRKEIPNG